MSPAAHAAPKRTPTEATKPTVVRGRPISFGFIPALDGLRALAVLGVMMYHGGAPIVGGGFLTIDVFFVLSGFLITSLLIGEWRKRLSIHLGQFWARRARRLLPALLVLLVGVAIYAKFFATPDEFVNLRLDSLSTLFYVANWHFIFAGTNYFNLTAQPSPLQHMWSLSIEEQFYLVWPPVVLAMLWIGNRLRPARRLWPLFAASVIGALGSSLDMALLYHGPASVMRVYEGTDTRSQDLLVGAALAVGMAIWAQHRPTLAPDQQHAIANGRTGRVHPATGTVGTAPPPAHRRDLRHRRGVAIRPIAAWELPPGWGRTALQVAGWVVIAVFAYLWSHLTAPDAFLFRGGYLLVGIGVAIVIFVAVTNQLGGVSRAIGNPVFQYVGKISYGTYLWHFPLFAILSAQRMHLIGYPLLAIRIGVTLLVATASFYLVEEPVRRGKMRTLTEWRAWLTTSAAFLVVVAVTVVATLPSVADAAPAQTARPTGAQYRGPVVQVDLFGDSLAFTLGESMYNAKTSPEYDVHLIGGANIGCGLMLSDEGLVHGMVADITPACNLASPTDQQWPALMKANLASNDPNVTMLLAGRWEVTDLQINGKWEHIGESAFDALLTTYVEEAVSLGTANGQLMILMTAPCFDSGEQPSGQPWPEDSAIRLADYNNILRKVAAEHPQTTEVYDFGSKVCPGGAFERVIDGITIREADGIHFPYLNNSSIPTGQWLAAQVYPEAVRVGRLQMAGMGLNGQKLTDGG